MRGVRVETVHGVLESERAAPQPFEIDLDLFLDTRRAAGGDDLGLTADYGTAVAAAVSVLRGPPRRLLETLAQAVADAVLADERVEEVGVTVRKLRPPLPHVVTHTAVSIRRRRGDHPGTPR